MTEFERFAEALAKTESDDRELAWGDPKEHTAPSTVDFFGHRLAIPGRDFMAMGRWQMHPAWYAEWADPAMQVGWSWDEAFRAALRKFWDAYDTQSVPIGHRVMIFHLGASAFARGQWDQDYFDRFHRFWWQLGG